MTKTKKQVKVVKEVKEVKELQEKKIIRQDKIIQKIITGQKQGHRKGTGHSKGIDFLKYVSLKELPLNKIIYTKDIKGLQTRDYIVDYFSDSPRRIIIALYKIEKNIDVKVEINEKDNRNLKGRRYYSFVISTLK